MVASDARTTEISDRYIECGESGSVTDTQLHNYAVPAWTLIGRVRVVDRDSNWGVLDYGLPVVAVNAAIAFYERHREVIDDRIRTNDIDAA